MKKHNNMVQYVYLLGVDLFQVIMITTSIHADLAVYRETYLARSGINPKEHSGVSKSLFRDNLQKRTVWVQASICPPVCRSKLLNRLIFRREVRLAGQGACTGWTQERIPEPPEQRMLWQNLQSWWRVTGPGRRKTTNRTYCNTDEEDGAWVTSMQGLAY